MHCQGHCSFFPCAANQPKPRSLSHGAEAGLPLARCHIHSCPPKKESRRRPSCCAAASQRRYSSVLLGRAPW